MPVDRLLPSEDAAELIALTRDIADKVLDPIVDEHERTETYPDGVFPQLGAAGLLSLPQPEQWGGGGQPYEVYLQVLEEIAARWATVAVAVSVHSLSTHALLSFGTEEQKGRWLPGMLSGNQIGAYSLSEPQAGSDAAALRCAATRDGDHYVLNGSKAWITHGGKADFYTLFARTGDGSKGISCFLVPGDLEGLSFGKPEEKMGLHAVPTTAAFYDNARLDADRLIGAEGQGLSIAFSALDAGRLGIAAVAVGIAQAALDEATRYANERTTFGRKIIDHQGLGFVLADMAAAVVSARATYLDAARRRDLGLPYSTQASVAKLIATDAAMKVTTDAVQVLGGVGYTRDFRPERYMREAKITQIFEGTNQIQRLVIARGLTA
ncbi:MULTISPECIES: acyl-CoA dehydrogenase family protein [Mycobacteriaceae]|uniref:Acyl-CoA dehydrogenase n=1 Tax=Mycolicibacterium neoaurum VKM Ac-1815D TaxID=700508 RepID=V5X6E5_MYCNE|nr:MULTISPECIES: acyl-CoA dehydrogenase family protein [Mycobacteriaceae]AHC23393.1 acyl-CoA dehydrogenase [Mycolicibacterium neoaurum VKM Ac-1815D]AMO04115.1 acyl-CoA dehydrogenase [Mycolicibacterium neoaurum]AXK77614.1 acyl-CoA dehydrogenase [Mycolicibacterium neoaurum]KJQ49903.1 acyl-CoA dehydrogenase [Mycolicibacterium neoaurum]KUM07692.1 acyl-CoA dehydrogenase [Mycolicibacterium neoaurum]